MVGQCLVLSLRGQTKVWCATGWHMLKIQKQWKRCCPGKVLYKQQQNQLARRAAQLWPAFSEENDWNLTWETAAEGLLRLHTHKQRKIDTDIHTFCSTWTAFCMFTTCLHSPFWPRYYSCDWQMLKIWLRADPRRLMLMTKHHRYCLKTGYCHLCSQAIKAKLDNYSLSPVCNTILFYTWLASYTNISHSISLFVCSG